MGPTTFDRFKSWVDYAKAHDYWLTIVYHEVVPASAPVCTPENDDQPCLDDYATTVPEFTKQLDYLAAQGIGPNVKTVQQALDIATNHYPNGTASLTPTSPTAPTS